MKTSKLPALLLPALLLAAVALSAMADPATGWKQTAAGTYDYNDAANWVGGVVNGVFGSDLTLAGAQTLTFSTDTTLANGLDIAYKGNYAMTFQSDGTGAKTLTLGGDISEALQGNASAIVTIGGTDENALVLDLGGENRTITAAATQSDVGKSGILSIPAVIQNGALTIDGAKTLKLAGANTYAGGTTISGNTYVYVNSGTAFGTGDVSINGSLNLCADNALTMTANNTFYMNAASFAYRSGKALDIGTGDFVATNSFQFWAEGDALTIHGRIIDKDGNLAPWKLEKWGSKKLYTYSDANMPANGKFIIGNGEWYFYGSISGSGFTVDASVATSGTQHFRLNGANTYQGALSITGGSLYVYAGDPGAIPAGTTVSIGAGTYFIGNGQANYVSTLLSNNVITKNSAGTLCLNSNDNGNIDLTDYPNLILGSRGGNRTLSGTIAWPDINPIRLGGGGDILAVPNANAIPPNRDLEILGKVQFSVNNANGAVTVRNGGMVILDGAAASLPNAKVVVERGGELMCRAGVDCDAVRVADLTLKSGTFSFEGGNNKSVIHRIAKLTLLPMEGVGGTPQIYWSGTASKKATLYINEIVRPDFGFLNLGSGITLGAADLTNGMHIFVPQDVVNLGGGTVGTTTAPVVPWIRHDDRFVYNDPVYGLRFQDTTTELQSYSSSGTISSVEADNENLFFTAASGTLTITAEEFNLTTLSCALKNKSLSISAPDSTIHVTGAALTLNDDKMNLTAKLDFGANRGYVMERSGKPQYVYGSIAGSGGLTIGNWSTSSAGTGVYCGFKDSTFTGDVHIFDTVQNVKDGCFPSGSGRKGNVYLHGTWDCGGGDTVNLNGLYGAGIIKSSKSTNGFVLGNDGSDGDFGGTINASTSYKISIAKVGAGCQRMSGVCNHSGATTVSAGTLQVDGSFTASAVSVASGATLGGVGSFGQTVTVADGGALEAGSAQVAYADDHALDFGNTLTLSGDATLRVNVYGKQSLATVHAAAVSGAGTVTVAMDSGDYSGDFLLVKSDAALPCTFAKGANCGGLALRNNGTELWVSHVPSTVVLLR